MMIKFSWKRINNRFDWNPTKVLQYFYMKQKIKNMTYIGRLPIPRLVKLEANKAYPNGPCFIVNIDEALKNASSPNDLYIYLELASKRNLFDYKMRGTTYLPIHFVDEYLMGIVHTNPMLEVKNDKLYFKYEQR